MGSPRFRLGRQSLVWAIATRQNRHAAKIATRLPGQVPAWPPDIDQLKNRASVSSLGLGVISDTTIIVINELSNITTTGMIS